MCICDVTPTQTIVKDFAKHIDENILREAMKWAPKSTRSHLIEYLICIENATTGLNQHSGLALATEGVLSCVGYNRANAQLAVSQCIYIVLFLFGRQYMLV